MGRLCGLGNVLPHGYEGQGAEHPRDEIERYLQLWPLITTFQVCIPSNTRANVSFATPSDVAALS